MGRPPTQFDTPEKENLPEGESPVVLRRCSLTSSMAEEDDDGFMEILDEEEMKVGRALLSGEQPLPLCSTIPTHVPPLFWLH